MPRTPKPPTRGGARPGSGPKAPAGRGRGYNVYLTPPEAAVAAARGSGSVQAGIRRLIEDAGNK